jgi:hypothetical protein
MLKKSIRRVSLIVETFFEEDFGKNWAGISYGKAEQFNGREGETATFLSRCPLNSNGFGGGFALRHLNR